MIASSDIPKSLQPTFKELDLYIDAMRQMRKEPSTLALFSRHYRLLQDALEKRGKDIRRETYRGLSLTQQSEAAYS